jgi:hypothetical protein
MPRLKKKKLLAALASTAGALITLTVVTPDLASAQSDGPGVNDQAGSRLCGTYWKSPTSGEIITRILEVSKKEGCTPQGADGGVPASPFNDRFKDKDAKKWKGGTFTGVVCESWKSRTADQGGLAGRDLNFIGNNFPMPHDQQDICNNMRRTDSQQDPQTYWLYDDNNPATKAVDFQRG